MNFAFSTGDVWTLWQNRRDSIDFFSVNWAALDSAIPKLHVKNSARKKNFKVRRCHRKFAGNFFFKVTRCHRKSTRKNISKVRRCHPYTHCRENLQVRRCIPILQVKKNAGEKVSSQHCRSKLSLQGFRAKAL